ncbi:UNVERIFIED_CONTAM: hypothetical protein FKN15_036575 [Acipenser sinensis]
METQVEKDELTETERDDKSLRTERSEEQEANGVAFYFKVLRKKSSQPEKSCESTPWSVSIACKDTEESSEFDSEEEGSQTDCSLTAEPPCTEAGYSVGSIKMFLELIKVTSSRGPCTLDTIITSSYSNPPDAKVVPEEITPLVPAVAGEKIAEDQTCYFLQIVLKDMVIQASSLEWRNRENKDTGFRFLFTLFKKYYLPHLFPSFTKLTNVYKPLLDIPQLRPKPLYLPVTRNNESTYCTRDQFLAARVAFIKWLVTFFLEKKYVTAALNTKNGGEVLPKIIQTVTAGSTSQEKNSEAESNGPAEQDKSHSNSSTLSDRRLSNSSLCSIEEEHRTVYDMVQWILLSTRDNVNFVNEVFHQAFLLPSCEASATRKVIKVYKKWILQDKPVFMTEPEKSKLGEEEGVHSDPLQDTETDSRQPAEHPGHKRSSSWGRTYSFSSAISRGCINEEENADIKAGVQSMLQVFLTNSSNVFLLEPCPDVPKLIEDQVDVCKSVLNIYRKMIMEHTMNKQTWEQMLQVLLRITDAVMRRPQENTKDVFATSLAGMLFRTIIVAWVRASLSVLIARELWDELLSVLSSLTAWEELVIEWANIMDSLTGVVARSVYGLDMSSLPLDRLSEQKEKKQRGRGVVQDTQKGAAVGRSFSLSWRSHPEVQEPMRFRSATTSGAPGVEKARNMVRQKATEISRVRKDMYNDTLNGSTEKRSSELPDAVGAIIQLQEKLYVPVKEYPDVSMQACSVIAGMEKNTVEVDESQQGDSPADAEHLDVDREQHLTRSSSTSDIAQQCGVIHVEVDESQQGDSPADAEHLDVDREQHLTRSSSTSDIAQQFSSNSFQGNRASAIYIRRSSNPGELEYPGDGLLPLGRQRQREKNSSECLADDISIIAGGSLTGWHPDSAAVLWRRVLGILGDVNSIQCPKIHAKVFLYLHELWHKLAKIRDNLGISADNQSSPPRPLLIPPLTMFASWLFKATTLPPEYKEGKLHAYRLICEMMTKHQDVLPNSDFLVHFYHVMHKGFISDDQDVLNTVVRYCSPRFFFLGLPGFTMLVGDFISAAARILGSDALEDYFINILLKNARSEPSEGARCIAVCSLGVWICEELAQCTSHPHVKDAINVMGVTLKFGNKVVAHVACDIFHLLVCHWQNLQKYDASLPKKITEIFVATIAFLLPSAEHSTMEVDKKLMVSLLLCLLDWCMAIPLKTLLEPITMPVLEDPYSQKAPLLDYIYRVLHCCVHGSNIYTQQSHYLLSLADLSATDYDPFLPVGNVRNSEPPQSHTSVDFGNLLTVAEEKKRRNMELIPLTARMIMTHLVNHLSHHPLSGGPAILHSLISENHDNDYVESSELSSEVFRSPNLQLFVFNDSTLVSYLQIPAEKTGAGEPPGAAADVRVIVRDISGKYSWDGGVLYGPLDGQSSSSCKDQHIKVPWGSARPGQKVHPMSWDSEGNSEEGQDVLDNLLENLGSSSPECLSQQQGKLNDPAPPPLGMSHEQEHTIMEAILRQSSQEEAHVKRWHSDISMKVGSQKEPAPQESKAPFYFCRLLLNDLGMNSWDRSRETHKIAVFYIGDGQEDKCSILSNTGGTQAYEDFVSGLGWEVDLSTHCGFMGGLQRNGSTGQTAPYYATSTVEVIFHVSTRMPSDPDDSLTRKGDDAEKLGLAHFPPLEASIAVLVQAPILVLLSKDTTCPNKQCWVSEVILKRAYSASAFAAWLENYNSILVAYQSHLLRSPFSGNHRPSPQQLDELRLVNKNLLCVFKLNGQAAGEHKIELVTFGFPVSHSNQLSQERLKIEMEKSDLVTVTLEHADECSGSSNRWDKRVLTFILKCSFPAGENR